jgi:ABC-type multidrug transport system fused ATPase/permease subunit
LGKTRTLTEDDIGDNISKDNVRKYLAKFEENLKKGKPENIASTIWKTFSHRELSAVMCKLTSDIMSYLPPLCINFIVDYAGDQGEWRDYEIFLIALVMLVAPLITGLCNHWFYQFVMNDGLHARTTIQAAVYSKILRISNTARTRKVADGGVADMVTNLQSTDCRSIEMVYWMWMYVWAAPLQVVITTVLLYLQLGWVVLVGIGVLLLLIPVQKCMMSSLKELTAAASAASDQRIKLITEVIHGVQVVKLQAWESMFAERVEKARALELKTRRRIAFLQGTNTAITESSAVLSTVATFVTYGLAFDIPLTPGKAFTTLALFNILRTPITVLPMLIGMVAGGLVASKRLARFLYSDDAKSYVKRNAHNPKDSGFASVVVKNASFTWGDGSLLASANTNDSDKTKPEGNPFTLSIADLKLTPGSLCVIAGKVGAGKSSFLAALIGEMVMTEGVKAAASVELNGSVAFCSQEPWIQSASLRDNILFGRPYDTQRYRNVLQVRTFLVNYFTSPISLVNP